LDKKIGFIGLGQMGKPMAANLIKSGFQVSVTYHRNRAPAEELQAQGAQVLHSVKEIAENSDVVITILPEDKEIYEVYTAKDGLLNHLKKESICIEMTSAKPNSVKDINKIAIGKGIHVLDAPVSGGIAGAEQGKLTIMAGGNPKLLESSRTILEAMGDKIYYTGDVGSGKAIKMINQLINAGNTYIASEALYLAKQLELDMEIFKTVIKDSSGGSFVFNNAVIKAIIPEHYESGFKLELMKKDIRLSIEQANEKNLSLPVSNLIYQIYQSIHNQGYGGSHYGVVSKWVHQQNKS
jgi:3-hydroxyisobutyrate dehydrogenase-like beta-hydroxyacid dehydrogenase